MVAILARAERLNPVLNVFTRIDHDAAMSVARASERRWKRGKPLSPIDGVPVSIKEGRIDGADTARQGITPDHGIG
jgi:Asp-tRNA(Asn)/Glu-tRNA(Gln) amidotransferase A subunit family amidase